MADTPPPLPSDQIEPNYEVQNPMWNCPVCGRFQSERSPAHEECGKEMYEDWVQSERAWAEGW